MYDIFLLTQLNSLQVVDLADRASTMDPMFALMDEVIVEQQITGLVVFVLGFRMVKYLRFLPVCGPEIISIVMTVFHREVLLYVTVVCLVLALFSISGQVVFGSWIDLTPMTFIRIFNLNFAEKKNDFFEDAAPGVESQVIVMAMYLFYIIFALVALNLFIGLVTDWYPKIRAESHRQWHYILTREMAYSVYNTFSFRCNGVGKMHQTGLRGRAPLSDPTKLESVCFKAAIQTAINPDSLLRGMDGERFWQRSVQGRRGVWQDRKDGLYFRTFLCRLGQFLQHLLTPLFRELFCFQAGVEEGPICSAVWMATFQWSPACYTPMGTCHQQATLRLRRIDRVATLMASLLHHHIRQAAHLCGHLCGDRPPECLPLELVLRYDIHQSDSLCSPVRGVVADGQAVMRTALKARGDQLWTTTRWIICRVQSTKSSK